MHSVSALARNGSCPSTCLVGREHVFADARHRLDDRDRLIGQRHQMRFAFGGLALDLHFRAGDQPRLFVEVQFVPFHPADFLTARAGERCRPRRSGRRCRCRSAARHQTLRSLGVGHRGVALLLVELAGGGQHEFEIAAPCRRVVAGSQLFDLGGVEQFFDPLAGAVGGDRLFPPDRFQRGDDVGVVDLVQLHGMQARARRGSSASTPLARPCACRRTSRDRFCRRTP